MAQRVIGELVVAIKGNKSHLDTTLDQAQTKFKSVADNLGKIGNVMSLAVTAPLTVLGGVILRSVGQMEQLQTSFEVMLGSADKAAKLMGDLKKMAATTPFETTQLANASKLLLQYGVSVEDLIPTMKMLGDISSGDAQKFSSLGLVMGQIRALGRLTGQDLRQMVGVGFNPLYSISEKTGESMASLTDKMSKGQISYDMVVESMKAATSEGGKFFQGMEKGSKTLEGLLSTLKDDFMESARALLEGFLPAIKDGVKFLSGLAQSFKDLQPGTKNFILSMIGILAAIGPVAKGISLFTKGLDLIHKHPAILIIGALVTLFLALKGAIENAATANGRMAQSIIDSNNETKKQEERFNELSNKVDLNKEEKEELIKVEFELKKKFGETAIVLDEQTGKYKANTEAARAYYQKNISEAIKYQQAQISVSKKEIADAEKMLTVTKKLTGQALNAKEEEFTKSSEFQLVYNQISGNVFIDENRRLQLFIDAQNGLNEARQKGIDANNKLLELGKQLLDLQGRGRPLTIEERIAASKKEAELKRQAAELERQNKLLEEQKKREEWLKKTAEERLKINQDYQQKRREQTMSELELLDFQMKEELTKAAKVGANKKNITEYYEKLKEDAVTKINEDAANKRDEIRKEEERKQKETQNRLISFAIDSVSQISSLVSSSFQNRISEIDEEYARNKEAIEGSVASEAQKKAQLEKLDEEYREKTKKAKQEEFAANKTFAIIDIAIKTAMAIARAFSDYPFPYSAIVAGIVGALGIAQTAVVASQPMPQFGTGGLVMPQEGGVPVIVAERRTPEFIIPDNGNVWQQVGDRIVQSMSRPINNNINNQVNLPNTLMVNIGGKEFMGFLTDASRAGKFSISQKHGLSRRD